LGSSTSTLGRRERSILLRHPVVSAPKLRATKWHLRGRAVHRHPRRIRPPASEILPCRSEPFCSSFW
jgi:hypothetical protein